MGNGRTKPGGRRTLALARMASGAEFLARNAVECLPDGALAARLAAGRPLRVKLGLDPTAKDLHLGHTVVLQKLREFQDAGHTVVLIIGDYTARVGDPSGRAATRPVLSPEEIEAHAQTYLDQATKVLAADERLEVRRNAEWLDMPMEDLFRLVRNVTVAQMLERDDFAKRMAAASRSRCSSCSIRCSRAMTRSPSGPTSSSAAPIRRSTCSWGGRSRRPTASRPRSC